MLELLKNQEGDAKVMYKLGQFYLRIGKIDKAEIHLKDAFAFEMENKEIALSYACFLC